MNLGIQPVYALNLYAGWLGFLTGAASGAVMGLFFHRADWLGGYGSFPRRMVRLGHIACFGIGLINLLFALSLRHASPAGEVASLTFLVAMVSMPLLCFGSAWRESLRHLFFVPVTALSAGIVATLLSLP